MSVYMTWGDLGQPAALSFRTTEDDRRLGLDVQRLAALWGIPAGESRVGQDDWLRAWRNIRVVARRFFDTLDPLRRCDPEIFHDLLLAVGNFKRQAGDIHIPVDLVDLSGQPQDKSLVLPGNLGQLDRDNMVSWQRLTQIPGLGPSAISF